MQPDNGRVLFSLWDVPVESQGNKKPPNEVTPLHCVKLTHFSMNHTDRSYAYQNKLALSEKHLSTSIYTSCR